MAPRAPSGPLVSELQPASPSEQVDLHTPPRRPPADLALGGLFRRVLVNGHLVEFVHLVGGVERGFELWARGAGAH